MQVKEFNVISNNSGNSQSLWMEVLLPSFTPLASNAKTGVCIVGAGIVGLTCAYTLAKTGKSVIVVDQGPLAGGQTARTTAHLTWVLDDRFFDLEKLFGTEGARNAANSHSAAIDYIEKIIHDENIDCDFERVDGFLFSENSEEILDKELEAIKRLGKEVFKGNTPFGSSLSLKFPRQAHFHILKYINGLVQALLKLGVQIFTDTHVTHFEEGPSILLKTEAGPTITADSVIVAAGTPVNNRFIIHTKQAAYRTYVIAATIPKGKVQNALYWDTGDPYHYIRLQKHASDPQLEWLIIGGEDHKTGQEEHIEDKITNLKAWAKKHFPFIEKFEYVWSGQVFEPIDSLGFIGKNPGSKNVYIATGDSGNGMTNGTIAGMLIPDLILGRDNPWKNLYDPARKTLSALPEFIHETFNTALQYRDWFTPGEHQKIESLNSEEGVILREGLKKIAVYKDEHNHIHVNSAFCPHLGGCVRWNTFEKSWDCPCHGSRFDGCGKVMNGPAISNLSEIKNPKNK